MNQVMRKEIKYLVNTVQMSRIEALISQVMKADHHNGATGYNIRSLYYDTLNEADYEAKIEGLYLRRIIRLRIYDTDSKSAKLEMKQKQGSDQKKRSLKVSKEDAILLTRGNYDVLLKYDEPFAMECYGLMRISPYVPRAIVEYKRKAFIAKENNIRITLDHQIRATESSHDLFEKDLNMVPVFDQFGCVLEVKYNGFLPSYIKDMLGIANKPEISVSKYCLCRSETLKFGF